MSFAVTVWMDELPSALIGDSPSRGEIMSVAYCKANGSEAQKNPDNFNVWSRPNGEGTGFIVEWKLK